MGECAMGRPRTPIGSEGRVTLTYQELTDDGRWATTTPPQRATKPKATARWRARVKYRDKDNVLRDVERLADTKSAAEGALKAALADRRTPRKGDTLTADTTLGRAGALWLEQVERRDSGLADRTRRQYRVMFTLHVQPSPLADVPIRDLTVGTVRKFLQGIADEHGAGAAKSVRSVVSNVLTMALHDDVLDVNVAKMVRAPQPQVPIVREVGERRAKVLDAAGVDRAERDTTRAFTREERDALVTLVRSDDWARRVDVADLIAFLAGTGVRINEALGVEREDVNLDAGTVHVRGTKTKTSDRVLSLAPWLVAILRERAERTDLPASVYLFPGTRAGNRRDNSNADKRVRTLLDRAGYTWATSHTFRHTVPTLLADSGMNIASIADYLGHADTAMTARYLGRGRSTAEAAALL